MIFTELQHGVIKSIVSAMNLVLQASFLAVYSVRVAHAFSYAEPPPPGFQTIAPERPTAAPVVVVATKTFPPSKAPIKTTAAPVKSVPATPAPVPPKITASPIPPTTIKPPTKAPVKPPTKAPVKPPSFAPIKLQTTAPVKPLTDAPIKPPSKPPTMAPVKPPTKAPVKPPTRRPTKRPTKAPVKPPTKAPVKPPTKPPTKRPTKAPVKPPTKAPITPPTTTPPVKSAAPMSISTTISNAPIDQATSKPTTTPAKTYLRPTKAPSKAPTSAWSPSYTYSGGTKIANSTNTTVTSNTTAVVNVTTTVVNGTSTVLNGTTSTSTSSPCQQDWMTQYNMLKEAWALWVEGPCYKFTIQRYAGSYYKTPVNVTVLNGNVTQKPSASIYVSAEITMKQHFAAVESKCFATCPSVGPVKCEATYDLQDGHFTSFFVDVYSYISGGSGFKITNFRTCQLPV